MEIRVWIFKSKDWSVQLYKCGNVVLSKIFRLNQYWILDNLMTPNTHLTVNSSKTEVYYLWKSQKRQIRATFLASCCQRKIHRSRTSISILKVFQPILGLQFQLQHTLSCQPWLNRIELSIGSRLLWPITFSPVVRNSLRLLRAGALSHAYQEFAWSAWTSFCSLSRYSTRTLHGVCLVLAVHLRGVQI